MTAGMKRKRDSSDGESAASRPRQPLLEQNPAIDHELDFASPKQEEVKLAVNDEYAKRFEFNKKREELHRCS